MVNRNIHLFLIPMPFCTFFVLLDFLSFRVLLMPFFSEFFIQAPLSIMSFCVRDVFNFQLTDGEELLAYLYSYDSILFFGMYCFFEEFWLLIDFSFSEIVAWDHLYMIYYLPCFLSVGLLLSAPWIFKMWNGWSLEIVFQTSEFWVIYKGLIWDFNECMAN